MKSKMFFSIFLAFLVLLAAGCGALPSRATPTPEPELSEEVQPVVSATGKVVPANTVVLSVNTAGVVDALEVHADDPVSEGQTLLRLKGSESLLAAIAAAQFELFSAEQALQDLFEDPEVRAAQALQAKVDAEKAVKVAQDYLKSVTSSASQADIDQAYANMILAEDRLDKARKDYRPYEKKAESNVIRAALLNKLAQAQKNYDAAVRLYNNLSGIASDLTIRKAQADLAMVEAQATMTAQDYEILQAGPDPKDIDAAQHRIANAKAQLSAAQAALKDLELQAPFTGMVAETYASANEWVAPGQPVLLLAELGHLQVETTDLNEIDVARLKTGDQATITFDALPEVVISGSITRIASKASEGSGVNYTVVLDLDEVPEGLRWGMTAFVDIEAEP